MEETERTGGGVDEEPKKEEGAIGPIRHMFGNQISSTGEDSRPLH